ncbi:MAG: thrombospondin type 3 repeat-containing protein, partial [Holophagales bacterium]|nr:thrombospondin type 3 repeat-containing protein [Holophagales bacterium]
DMAGTEETEFVELYDGGTGNTALDGLVVVLYNGNGDTSYNAFDLDGFVTDADGYFVIGGTGVAAADLTVASTFWLQNGADAVAVFAGSDTDFPNGTAVTTVDLVDAAVYGTADADDAGLLPLLNAAEPQIDEDGNGAKDTEASQRCPDGAGGPRVTSTYLQAPPTPGARNDCLGEAAGVVINEVDADTPGSDTAEFVELYDGGIGNVALDGLVLVVFNGSDDQSYNLGGQASALDLDGLSTDGAGFLVIGNAAVPGVDVVFGDGSLQNGADAVALYVGDGTDFPNDTPLTTTDLLDAVVYDTSDADDAGLLPLLLAGQPQVDENQNGAGSTESSQRCPDGAGGGRVTAFFRAAAPTPGAPTACVLEIHEIQGAADPSPFAGLDVTTLGNIVTAVGPEGFFLQTPDLRVDADPDTSQGIYVFIGSPPPVVVGDQVGVSGVVEEFFGFTQISGSLARMVDPFGFPLDPAEWQGLGYAEAQRRLEELGAVRSALPAAVWVEGNAGAGTGEAEVGVLPSAVIFDAATPSPVQPVSPVEFERFEGMRISVPAGTVCTGNQGFGSDPVAEVYVNATSGRCLRETGIAFPGLPGLPQWDGNPEVFELDLDKLGGPNPFVTGGTAFTAEGPLAFEFGEYEIWTTAYTETAPAVLPRSVRAPAPGELRIGSLNFFRLFDDVDDPPDGPRNDTVVSTAEYQRRLDKLALHILDVLGAPEVLGVQEAESLSVLQDLAAEIVSRDPAVAYTAYLEEGNDIGTIDVGFLVRGSVTVTQTTQLGKAELLTFDNSLLHDRPPFLLEGTYDGNGSPFAFAVMVNHTRSLGGVDDPADGPRVRQKRLEQAQSIAQKVQDFQTGPDEAVPLVVIGDLNAFEFTDGYVDVVGQIAGDAVPADNLLSDTNLTNPTLTKQVLSVPLQDRYSFHFRGNGQVLDHALTTQVADTYARGFEFGRGNADAAEELIEDDSTPLFSSDHDGFVLFLMTDRDADGVPDDVDNCPDAPNTAQADGDFDGVGDVCDNCVATANPDQADGDLDGFGDACDNCPADANADQADGDVDGVGHACDNCPADANADQADIDMDGTGDACDACNDLFGPVFTVIGEAPGVITLQVEDCAGIDDVSLEPGAENLTLQVLSGVPGDPVWIVELTAIDPDALAFGTVTADGANASGTFDVQLDGNVLAIPTAGDLGLLLLALLLASGALLTLRRVV